MKINNLLIPIPSLVLLFFSIVLLNIEPENQLSGLLFYAMPFPSLIIWLLQPDDLILGSQSSRGVGE